jgi:hypothetical protein
MFLAAEVLIEAGHRRDLADVIGEDHVTLR